MKKILMFIGLISLLYSCGYIKEYPTAKLELSKGGEDTSLYNFESSSDYGFTLETSFDASFLTKEISYDRAYMGEKSLKIKCDFTGVSPYKGGILKMALQQPENFTGKKFTCYVWIPKSANSETAPYGAMFYIKAGSSYKWYQSEWKNLRTGSEVVSGVWTKIEAEVSKMTDTSGKQITDATDIREWGIKVGQGDNSPNFNGYIYIDSIDIK